MGANQQMVGATTVQATREVFDVPGAIQADEFIGDLTGNVTGVTGDALALPTYGVSITPDLSAGLWQRIIVTNNVAFTINAPTNNPGVIGAELHISIQNVSGGAMGVITWDAIFLKSAFTNPANNNQRTISFKWDGTDWVEFVRTTADVPV